MQRLPEKSYRQKIDQNLIRSKKDIVDYIYYNCGHIRRHLEY